MKKGMIVLSIIILSIYVNNTSLLASKSQGKKPSLLAHRGVHQTYSTESLDRRNGCSATRIHRPEHGFLENTIESIQESFNLGAEIVEIDIYPTKDNKFVVFHDWKIDCRTNGKGKTRSHTLNYLQSLDIGYGYTHDAGRSFPFRGKGIGKMPSFTRVLDTFPTQKLLVNIKSNSLKEADLIHEYLLSRTDKDISRLWFYGGTKPTTRLLSLRPELKGFTRPSVKKCIAKYSLIGWSGYMPKSCRNTIVAIPKNYAPYLWGWPRKFSDRMIEVNTDIILVGKTNEHIGGIDSAKEIEALSKNYQRIIWTNKIEKVGSIKKLKQ